MPPPIRPAAGLNEVISPNRAPPPSNEPADEADNPHVRSPDTQERLLAEVAGALQANLARGFLEGEERIRQIAEAVHDAILLSDETGGEIFFVNTAYEQIWGRPRAELYANPLALLEGVHPEDRERVRDTLIGQLRPGYDLEFRVLRPSGDERWVWARGFPVRNAGDESNRIASIIEDITERKQTTESHERLIRGFTHDVKNPLGAADAYLSLMELGVYGDMSETQTQAVGRARRSIGTALNLVSGLLDIERAEAGLLDIERQRVDVGATTVAIVEEFRAAAGAKGIRLMSSVPTGDDSLVVESDVERVRQILANLVSNAVKFTHPNGSVSVSVHVARADDAPGRGRWGAVAVADNGPGIPLEKQSLVFREFTRFDPEATAGSGIGLAISRRLARALGGEITFTSFTSAPGVGSTFTLWLPLEPPATTEPRPGALAGAPA